MQAPYDATATFVSDYAPFLLVEDQEDDILLVKRSFLSAKILNPLQVVHSGEQAILYLQGSQQYADRTQYPFPELVLLDIKLPGLDGFEVLKWIRAQAATLALKVVMLTSSDDMRDVSAAYQIGANSFMIKPIDFERFVEFSQAMNGYWVWTQAPAPNQSADPGAQVGAILRAPPNPPNRLHGI